jgi:hypothetical protein
VRTSTVGPAPLRIHRHDAGLADLFGHLEAELAHLGGQLAGGAHFLEGDLRMGVQVLVDAVQPGVHASTRVLTSFFSGAGSWASAGSVARARTAAAMGFST